MTTQDHRTTAQPYSPLRNCRKMVLPILRGKMQPDGCCIRKFLPTASEYLEACPHHDRTSLGHSIQHAKREQEGGRGLHPQGPVRARLLSSGTCTSFLYAGCLFNVSPDDGQLGPAQVGALRPSHFCLLLLPPASPPYLAGACVSPHPMFPEPGRHPEAEV